MLLMEGEAIVTSQLKTTETINDVQINVPFPPFNLQAMKSKGIMLSPGSFGPADTYCHKHWKRTQHLVTKFWARCSKEFMQMLQEPKSCSSARRNFQKGDILLKAIYNRNHWLVAHIIKKFPINMKLYTAKLRHGDAAGRDCKLVWLIVKTALLVESNSPTDSKECWENCKNTG